MTDTFAAEQGAGEEATEDLESDILCEAGQCVPLARGLLTNEITKILF